MQTLRELNDNFAIADALSFEQVGELIIARVTSRSCTATLFLQGAHLVHWQPNDSEPVLFLSDHSSFVPGKAIRGGVPIIFPWFGARTGERTDGPSHGFARTTVWEVAFAGMVGEDVYLTLTLAPDDHSRSLGYGDFRAVFEVALGRTLTMRLGVVNQSEGTPLHFEEALHTYFNVGDAEQVRISGLSGTEFLDKTDNFARKRQMESVLTLKGETDRLYLNTMATVTIEDPVLNRKITVAKTGSQSTVVWNPWNELSTKLPDMADDGWRNMVCVETTNAADNALTLPPSEAHTLEAFVSVAPLESE
jgi:glucose-6-phosphate 1-epimerase